MCAWHNELGIMHDGSFTMAVTPLGNHSPLGAHPSLAGSKGREMGLETAQQEKQREKTQKQGDPKLCCLCSSKV